MKEKLLPFIGGSSAIGGIIHVTNGQIYSFAEAAELRLVKRSIAIEMLQAQVATGGVLNPKNGQKCELRNAIQTNLVPNEFEMHLQEAEKAFKGGVLKFVICEIAKTTISEIAKVTKIANRLTNFSTFLQYNNIRNFHNCDRQENQIVLCCDCDQHSKTELCYSRNRICFAIAISQSIL